MVSRSSFWPLIDEEAVDLDSDLVAGDIAVAVQFACPDGLAVFSVHGFGGFGGIRADSGIPK